MTKNFLIGSLITLTLFSSGCLKDEKFLEIDKTAPIVEFPIGGPGVVENSYDVTDISKNLDTTIAINIASPQPLDHDVKVTVRVTPTIVTEYNTVNGTAYTPLPANVYAIEDYTITIPKGYRIGRFKIKFLFPQFNLNETYAFALQIVDAPGLTISGNYNKFLWVFNLRNQYDGYYQAKGAAFHPTYGNYVFNSQGVFACGDGFALVTSGPNSVDLTPGQPLNNAGTLTFFSAVLPRFTVIANNKVSITSTNTTVFVQYPTYDSKYDPNAKAFYVKFGWSGDRVATDTFTYCGPR